MKIVKVLWEDTMSYDDWCKTEDATKEEGWNSYHETVGFLLKKTKTHTYVVSTLNSPKKDRSSGVWRFPNKIIKKVVYLNEEPK